MDHVSRKHKVIEIQLVALFLADIRYRIVVRFYEIPIVVVVVVVVVCLKPIQSRWCLGRFPQTARRYVVVWYRLFCSSQGSNSQGSPKGFGFVRANFFKVVVVVVIVFDIVVVSKIK